MVCRAGMNYSGDDAIPFRGSNWKRRSRLVRPAIPYRARQQEIGRRQGLAWTCLMMSLAAGDRSLAAQVVHLTVHDSLTTEGLSDAIVAMLDHAGNITASGRTRSGGTLVLKASAGSYTVFVR